MGFLAFGIFLLILGGVVVLTPLFALGWALIASGASLAVARIAVGPPRGRRAGEP